MAQDRDIWVDVFYNVSNFEKQGLAVDTRWNSSLAMTEEGWWLDPKSKDMGDGAKYYQHNIGEAKNLLAAAGHANGLEVAVTHPGNASGYPTDYIRQAEVLDQMMQEAGFKTTQKPLDYVSTFVPQYRDASGKFGRLIHASAPPSVTTPSPAWPAASSKAGTQFYGLTLVARAIVRDPKVDDLIASHGRSRHRKRRASSKRCSATWARSSTSCAVRWRH